MRCLLGYFYDLKHKDIPYQNINLHTLYRIQNHNYFFKHNTINIKDNFYHNTNMKNKF